MPRSELNQRAPQSFPGQRLSQLRLPLHFSNTKSYHSHALRPCPEGRSPYSSVLGNKNRLEMVSRCIQRPLSLHYIFLEMLPGYDKCWVFHAFDIVKQKYRKHEASEILIWWRGRAGPARKADSKVNTGTQQIDYAQLWSGVTHTCTPQRHSVQILYQIDLNFLWNSKFHRMR